MTSRRAVAVVLAVAALGASVALVLTSRRAGVGLRLVATGIPQPTSITSANDGSGRLFVTEQAGRIRVVVPGKGAEPEPFLDLRPKVRTDHVERGLHNIAFHPDFARNGRFFVGYSNLTGGTDFSEFRVVDGVALPASEKLLLRVEKPGGPHNGGQMQFGPRDSLLYLSTGDGGGLGEFERHTRDLASPLGKIMRLDVDGARPMEIVAMGLRNPWRFSFDRGTGDIYIGDAGAYTWEEVDLLHPTDTAVVDFGWDAMEGPSCYRPRTLCDRTGITEPVHTYGRDNGCAVIGGYVYRGTSFPAILGSYVFGDYCTGRIWKLAATGNHRTSELLVDSDMMISSFGESEDGSLYVADHIRGQVSEIVADSAAVVTNLPRTKGFTIVLLVAFAAALLTLATLGGEALGPAVVVALVAALGTALGIEVGLSQVFYVDRKAFEAVFATVGLLAVWGAIAERRAMPAWATPLAALVAAVPMSLAGVGFTNIGNIQVGALYPWLVLPLTMSVSVTATATFRRDRSALLPLGLVAAASLFVVAQGLEATIAQLLLLAAMGALLGGALLGVGARPRGTDEATAVVVGAVVAAAVIAGKFERAGPVVLGLFLLDLVLRGRLQARRALLPWIAAQLVLGAAAIALYYGRFDLM